MLSQRRSETENLDGPEIALIVSTSITLRQTLKLLYTEIMKFNLMLFFKWKRLQHSLYYTCTKIMIM